MHVINFNLVFDEIITRQLKKAAKNNHVKEILRNILDKIEELGPNAGELLDSKLFIYKVKCKHPPIRLYYKHNLATNEIYIFEYEIKTSQERQQNTIEKIKRKILEP